MMEGNFVRICTGDGLELQGLFCTPQSGPARTALVHVHGLAGNFYENRFIDFVAHDLTVRGHNFLTINNRGHDYVSDFLRKTDGDLTYVQIGGAHEIFEESSLDLQAWVAFLEDQGCKDIALQGHSLGATKVVFYQYQVKNDNIRAIILASPPDLMGLQKVAHGDRYEDLVRAARDLITSGRGADFMPPEALESYLIDARTYLSLFGPESKAGIFDFYAPDGFEELGSISVPILALFGTVDEAVMGDVNECLRLIQVNAKSSPRCETAVIEGAPHNYLGHEEVVAKTVGDWLAEVMPPR